MFNENKKRSKKKVFAGRPHTILGAIMKDITLKKEPRTKKAIDELAKTDLAIEVKNQLRKEQRDFLNRMTPNGLADHPIKSAKQILREKEDEEYQKLLNETLQAKQIREQEKLKQKLQKEEAEKAAELQKNNSIRRINEIREKFKALPPEPDNGITIAVLLPDMKRIVRRFAEDELGSNVYTWVANDEALIKDNTFPQPFVLTRTLGNDIEEDKTLEEQQLRGRLMLTARIEN